MKIIERGENVGEWIANGFDHEGTPLERVIIREEFLQNIRVPQDAMLHAQIKAPSLDTTLFIKLWGCHPPIKVDIRLLPKKKEQ